MWVGWFGTVAAVVVPWYVARHCRSAPRIFFALALTSLSWAFLMPYYTGEVTHELLPALTGILLIFVGGLLRWEVRGRPEFAFTDAWGLYFIMFLALPRVVTLEPLAAFVKTSKALLVCGGATASILGFVGILDGARRLLGTSRILHLGIVVFCYIAMEIVYAIQIVRVPQLQMPAQFLYAFAAAKISFSLSFGTAALSYVQAGNWLRRFGTGMSWAATTGCATLSAIALSQTLAGDVAFESKFTPDLAWIFRYARIEAFVDLAEHPHVPRPADSATYVTLYAPGKRDSLFGEFHTSGEAEVLPVGIDSLELTNTHRANRDGTVSWKMLRTPNYPLGNLVRIEDGYQLDEGKYQSDGGLHVDRPCGRAVLVFDFGAVLSSLQGKPRTRMKRKSDDKPIPLRGPYANGAYLFGKDSRLQELWNPETGLFQIVIESVRDELVVTADWEWTTESRSGAVESTP